MNKQKKINNKIKLRSVGLSLARLGIVLGVAIVVFYVIFINTLRFGPAPEDPTSPDYIWRKNVNLEIDRVDLVKDSLELAYEPNVGYPLKIEDAYVVLDEIKDENTKVASLKDAINNLSEFIYTISEDRAEYHFSYKDLNGDTQIVKHEYINDSM